MNKAALISMGKKALFVVAVIIAIRTLANFVPVAGPLVVNAMDNGLIGPKKAA